MVKFVIFGKKLYDILFQMQMALELQVSVKGNHVKNPT